MMRELNIFSSITSSNIFPPASKPWTLIRMRESLQERDPHVEEVLLVGIVHEVENRKTREVHVKGKVGLEMLIVDQFEN